MRNLQVWINHTRRQRQARPWHFSFPHINLIITTRCERCVAFSLNEGVVKNCTNHDPLRQPVHSSIHLGTALTSIYNQISTDFLHTDFHLLFSFHPEATLLYAQVQTEAHCHTGYLQFAPIKDSMRSLRLWRNRWTMKSSRERMRKDEMQLTMRRIPPAIESNRLFPSVT